MRSENSLNHRCYHPAATRRRIAAAAPATYRIALQTSYNEQGCCALRWAPVRQTQANEGTRVSMKKAGGCSAIQLRRYMVAIACLPLALLTGCPQQAGAPVPAKATAPTIAAPAPEPPR